MFLSFVHVLPVTRGSEQSVMHTRGVHALIGGQELAWQPLQKAELTGDDSHVPEAGAQATLTH